MKKLKFIIVVITVVILLTSCSNDIELEEIEKNIPKTKPSQTTEAIQKEKLYTPELHVNEKETIIYWQPQDNADYYILTIGNQEFIVRDTKFNYSIMPDGQYKISIISQKDNMNNCEVVPRKQEISIRVKAINYEEIINIISTDTIKSNVTIKVKHYNTFLGIETESTSYQGSGVIYKYYQEYSGEYTYYVLTNYHVVERNNKYDKYEITIEDYQGQIYEAYKRQTKYDQDYDLSVLNFTASKKLNFVQMAGSNPKANNKVISIGQPKGQTNSITMGECLKYTSIKLTNGFAPSFKVIEHNSPTNNGSSGGAIIDINQNLIGINFAGTYDKNGKFINGYSIPIETIKEYLKRNNFTY